MRYLNRKHEQKTLLLVIACTLCGCGGGGGGGNTPPPSYTPPPVTVQCTSLPAQSATSFTLASGTLMTVSWLPNRESRVNTTGGGYKVLISTAQYFVENPATIFVDAPNLVSAPLAATVQVVSLSPGINLPAPTAFTRSFTTGVYYIRIFAFAAFDAGVTSYSNPQQDITLTVVP